MTACGLSRRQFLLSTALISAFPLSCWSQDSKSPTGPVPGSDPDLNRFAYLLFPHPAVSGSVYTRIVNGLVAEAAGNPGLQGAVDQVKVALGQDWLSLAEASQIEKMRGIEKEPFFFALRSRIAGALYEQQEVWEAIRYDGPSLQYGGYKTKGIGSMDWLEEAGR
jgi:hypothetical protein